MKGMNPAYLCASTMTHVDEFIDGELGAQESAGIERHLLACASCRRAYQRELDLKQMIRDACECRGVPAELKDRVLMRISELRIDLDGATFESLSFRAAVYRDDPSRTTPGTG